MPSAGGSLTARLTTISGCLAAKKSAACAPDEFGELYVRGFSLMRGLYKRLPEDTFDRDGFYPTGDRCKIDADGYLYFDGRYGEMIKTSGANVAPREVERALKILRKHEVSANAALIGKVAEKSAPFLLRLEMTRTGGRGRG